MAFTNWLQVSFELLFCIIILVEFIILQRSAEHSLFEFYFNTLNNYYCEIT